MSKKSEIPFGAQFSPNQVEQPLSQILTDLKSPNKRVKNSALELLVVYISRSIGLHLSSWLLRSADSDGIEAEAIADDNSMPFHRWQIQCRNVSRVDMDDIATAVGRSVLCQPSVVLSVTTGTFTPRARDYVDKAMQTTNFQILLMDAQDLQAITIDDKAILNVLRREIELVKAARRSRLESYTA